MAKIDTTKAAAQAVAEKLAKGKGSSSNASTATNATIPNTQIDNHIPGLLHLTPQTMVAGIPSFHPEKFHIADPLNPPETIPQATEQQLTKGTKVYEGAVRALKLYGLAFDVTKEKFNVVGKHAKAFDAGIVAATELEKVRGHYLDYQNQQEITTQKSVTLDVSKFKTITDTSTAIHTKDELSQKLKQAELKAQETRFKTLETQDKLASFKEQLGNLVDLEVRK
ncbi:hypothetical protein [Nostoc sp. FACHB-190]|uniref:hypothetical protein n=1 Tax=Nostoc sp. FACHB-190 TaxID=2692838 RepID=UPI001686B8A4|nr:hypothetical protein [Nostoc sp. FACHB-190]MBD2303606.1 hypothetical protein [Nostoc sp. FACHB-190]